MRDRRVVVTGLGAITAIGNDLNEYWDGLKNGKNGVGLITQIDTENHKSKIAAEVKNFDLDRFIAPKEAKRMDPFTQYGIAAAIMAVEDSGLDFEKEDPTRTGVLVGSGIGGMKVYNDEFLKLVNKGPGRISPFFIPMMIPDIVPGHISIRYGLMGPNYSCVSACASASHSIGAALMHIQRGDVDMMITGGTESVICDMAVGGFSNMKALSTRNDDPEHASRPFDKERDGFVIGEGSGIIVLEEMEHALARGADIYAELAGFGFTGDAFHITAPHENGQGASNAMARAMEDAGVNPQDIVYINAHGTSTPPNDRIETLAIKNTFGDHARKLCISSNKSMIGHLLGASGAAEFVASSMTIKHGVVPPTINYEVPDPECDLDYVPHTAREMEVNTMLSNSFGFGGHNVSLCLKKFEK